MKHLLLPVPLLLLLAACGGATVISSSLPCRPPTETMVKADPLAPVTASSLKMTEIVQRWLDDDQKYNILTNKDSALIDWVNVHCQK